MFEFLFKYPRDVYTHGQLVFTGQWPTPFLYVIAAIAIAAITFFLYGKRQSATPVHLALVSVLQVLMLAVVVWVLMAPAISTERLRDSENTVALVLDTSQSMAYGADRPRIEEAVSALSTSLSDERVSSLSVQRYELSADADAIDSFHLSAADGPQTALANSLESVLREARFAPLAAVILASDGADTGGGLTVPQLAELASFGIPVHTIGVGREALPEDLELAEVVMPSKALPGTTLSGRVAIRHDGAGTTRVKVYDGDQLLASVPVELQPDSAITTATIDIELAESGHRQLELTLAAGDRELELRNNTRSRIVEVAKENYRILYFEGEPRWEYKFLRRAVGNDNDLKIVSLLRVSPNKFYRQGLDSPDQLEDGFPDSRDELFVFDALIIGSVEAVSLSTQQQELIREFVAERGGGLLMLAGPNGLGNGGWGQSKVAAALPSRLPPSDTQSFIRKQAKVSLTAQGAASEILRFEKLTENNSSSWATLPAVADYQLTNELKPAAVALLQFTSDTNEQLPLLITQPFGRGHTYILATGGTWRWQMSLPLEDERHERFWRQLLRALVSETPRQKSLTTAGQAGITAISLRAEFRDDAFRPLNDVSVSALVSHEDGDALTVPLAPSPDEPGVFGASIEPGNSGTYYVEAIASRSGEPFSTIRTSFRHEADHAEHFNLRKNSGLLQRLSEATGGRYFEPDALDQLPELLRYSRTGITVEETRPIWNAPAVFLLLVLLKAGEWLLRRRWGTI